MENLRKLIEQFEAESNLVKNSAAQIVRLLTSRNLSRRVRIASVGRSISGEDGELLDEYLELRKQVPIKYSNAFLVRYSIGEFDSQAE